MQLALFQPPPAEARRTSTSRRVGGSSANKRGLEIRLQRRPGVTRPKSDPRLSFLKPAPSSADLEAKRPGPQRPEVLGDRAVIEGREGPVELDAKAGKGASIDEGPAPHPTRGKMLPPEVFTADEVRALIGACSIRGVTGHRNRALLAILWRTGIRISEALELRPYDIDFKNGTIRVRLGKGLKPRTTVLSDLDALPLVERWLEAWKAADSVGRGLRCSAPSRGRPPTPAMPGTCFPDSPSGPAWSGAYIRMGCGTPMRPTSRLQECPCWRSSSSWGTTRSPPRRTTSARSVFGSTSPG